MEQYRFVVNPAAGGRTCIKKFAQTEELLRRRNIPYTAVYSEHEGHACELVRQLIRSGDGVVVAVGGDGTAREVAQELLHTGIPMGILPFGTGNDLCKALRIPRDAEEAVDLLCGGEPRPIDAATVNGRLFLNVAGLGFDVDVLDRTQLYKRKFHGILPYILGLLQALLNLSSYEITLRAGDVEYSRRAILVSVGNGTHIGGGMMVTPKAHMSDGLLDVCVVDSMSRGAVLRRLPRFIKGRHLDLGFTSYFRAEELTVACSPGTRVQLDGEIIEQTPAVFRILPGALNMIAGPIAERAEKVENKELSQTAS